MHAVPRMAALILAFFLPRAITATAAPTDPPVPPKVPPQGMASVIPEDTLAVLAVRHLDELIEKGDSFLKKNKIQGLGGNEGMRLGTLVEMVLPGVGIREGLDRTRPILLMFPPPVVDGQNTPKLRDAVLAVPFSDKDAITAGYGFEQGDVQPGKVYKTGRQPEYLAIHNRYLYLGLTDVYLKHWIPGKPLAKGISPPRLQAMNSADVLLGGGGPFWAETTRELFRVVLTSEWFSKDELGKSAAEKLKVAAEAVRFWALGFHLEEQGLKIESNVIFDQSKKDPIVELLTELRGGGGASSLAGLPAPQGRWRPVMAYAARGKGQRNVAFARALLRIGLASLPGSEQWFDSPSREQLASLFSSVWGRLSGSRAAVYIKLPPADAENATEEQATRQQATQATAFLILDLDPEEFLQQLPEVVQGVNATGASLVKDSQFKPVKFRYQPNAVQIQGQTVGHLIIEEIGLDPQALQPLPRLLGKDWRTLRLIPAGKHLVVQAGGNKKLLQDLLDNLQNGQEGLASDPSYAKLDERLGTTRKVEFHIDLTRYVPLAYSDDRGWQASIPLNQAADASMTSLGLTIDPEHLQLDMWFPNTEAVVILRALGYK